MANTNSDASDEAKTADAKAVKKPIDLDAAEITIDRSRPVSEIHGEHLLGFIQDGLPFDKGGRLHVPSLSSKEYGQGRDKLLKRLERLAQEEKEAIDNPVADTSNLAPLAEQIETDPDAHINLVDWAKGKVKVMPHRVYNIAQRRLGKRFNTVREIADEMVKRKMLLAEDVRI